MTRSYYKSLTEQEYMGGVARTYEFESGHNLSVVKHDFSYGGPQGKWEIAVFNSEGDFVTRDVWHDLEDDVMGWVKEDLLDKYINDVYWFDREDVEGV